ncbi:acyl-CoA thioesterase [Nocardia vaccinii]|uniref:acyl-CoA thioesterase n=1 Tax=Nocardia vaccinii TaxID=1822 RepID=UPI000829733D|nr:thioesterase family protein [Nocardia vaccinii]
MTTEATSLELATSLEPVGAGIAKVALSPAWWIEGTAYGGYLAALLLRAAQAECGQDQRPLSLTVHFISAVRPGPAEVQTRAVSAGRSSSTVTATLSQGGSCRAFAVVAFGRDRGGPLLDEHSMPVGDPPELSEPLTVRAEVRARFPLHARFERRRLAESARKTFDVGGWIRLSDPQPLDYLSAVTFLDSWVAAATTKVAASRMLTLVYFVQFLCPLPLENERSRDYALAVFRSGSARDGYAEDDGELWNQRGTLLARAQQVVVIGV